MKRILLLSCLILAALSNASAYVTVTVKDSISTNTTWTCDKQYLLEGYVYVTAGATLTINPGTIIRGDKDTKGALIIERGAKIMAMGTLGNPIVFTSNQEAGSRDYGDWGGVVICGKAPTNWNAGQGQVEGGPRSFYGGTDAADNSGEMHYVRIEYGGIAFSPNNEVNALTLCGVGSGTQIDHIQVSYGGDDGFEFFGGTVNAKHLVSVGMWDDDFDNDNGYSGKLQFLVAVRDPFSADNSGSKAVESDSYLSGTYSGIPVDLAKMTTSIVSNATLVGPLVAPTSTAFNDQYTAGVHLRRGSSMSILNSVIMGFPCGLLIDESSSSYGSTTANIASNELQFRNNIIAGSPNFTSGSTPRVAVYVKDGARSLTPVNTNADSTTGSPFTPFAGPLSFFYNAAFGNRYYSTSSNVRLTNPFNLLNPNPIPTSTSPISYNISAPHSASNPFDPADPINYDTTGGGVNYNVPTVPPQYGTSKASDPFFTSVNYIGAFAGTTTSATNWMNNWCEFDPNNADYDTICYVAPPPPPTGVTDLTKIIPSGINVYPNPTSGNATVAIEVRKTCVAKITVMDVTGKMVKTIANTEVTKGTQTFDFNTSDLASGMYIMSVNMNGKTRAVRFNVVK
ncbi:MAG: T9SS type A sorting domain-containing protein [Taibaiella sp.]|nr:T9SS type A sorting domain-containing protein [Taibaiella sp.]